MRPSERADSRRNADEFDVLSGTPFLITPYRYQKIPNPKSQIPSMADLPHNPVPVPTSVQETVSGTRLLYGSDIKPSVTSSGMITATSASPAMRPDALAIE